MSGRAIKTPTMGVLILLFATVLSGCIKGTSDLFVEEVEVRSATRVSIVNPLGSVRVTGVPLNNEDGLVYVKTESYVDTYSLFGLAHPNEYIDKVAVTPVIDNGVLSMDVHIRPRGILDRLFVRIIPHVNRIVEAPSIIVADAEIQVGDLELRHLPGDVRASVSAGKVKVDSPIGVYGEQEFTLNVGELDMTLPGDAGFRYNLAVDMGTAEATGFDLNLQRRLMGARGAGLVGAHQNPGLITANVNIDAINIKGQ